MAAKKCERCDNGTIKKKGTHGNIIKKPCPDCKGLGKIVHDDSEDAAKEGVYITERPEVLYGRDHIFANFRNDRLKASIKTKVRGIQKVLNKKRELLDGRGIGRLKRMVDRYNNWRRNGKLPRELEDYIIHDDYLVIDIENMTLQHTSKDKGKGYMHETITVAKRFMDQSVRYIMTNWDDSTKEGRNYLLRQGFKRDKTILIWENPAHDRGKGYLQTPDHDNAGDVHDTKPALVESGGQKTNSPEGTSGSGDQKEDKATDS